ncbi:hypothetical protein A3K72_01035 [Candidatus Woesearchaeota archaeon RBG_13_36_6]|nr:MAG: hypothetical protein A3K72_01035 [Candidatus Woesearchaeota archaeon RBG_13_36_6]
MTKDKTKTEIYDLLNNLPRKKINNQRFDKLLYIDEIPLWWFFKEIFILSSPSPFLSINDVTTRIYNKEDVTNYEKLKMWIYLHLYHMFIRVNEKIKHIISYLRDKKFMKNTDVLFIAHCNQIEFGNKGKRFKRIGDIVESLNKKIEKCVLVVDPFSINSFLKLVKVDYLIYDFIDKDIIKLTNTKTKRIIKNLKTISDQEFTDFFKINKVSIWPYIKYQFNFFISGVLVYHTILHYETFKKIFKNKSVKLVVLTSEVGLTEKCALAAANALKIKSLIVPHGVIFSDALNLKFDEMGSTKFAVFGEEQKKQYIIRGIKKENIVVTGPVVFDDVIKFRAKARINRREILFLTQAMIEKRKMSKEEYFNRIKGILREIKKVDIDSLTIKLHPIEKYEKEYQKLISEIGFRNVKIIKDSQKEVLYQLISKSNLVISLETGATIECLMLDKPVIILHLSGSNLEEKPKFIISLKSEEQLAKQINKVLNDKLFLDRLAKERRKFIKNYCYKGDGKAYKRVAEYIYEILYQK